MATTINFQPLATGSLGSSGNRLGSIDPRLSRTNYFDGQLLKASDLTRDQIYLDERLLEVGQAFGSGIAQGLELSLLDQQRLHLEPGLAIAPSGRVLQLAGRTLDVNLLDAAQVAIANQGKLRRLARGLYAVALQHAEVVDGLAEAYPADLASRRQLRVSAYAEGVELVLFPLALPLPRGDGLAARAALARELVQGSGRLALPGDDAVALGLLAMGNQQAEWLDLGLLRRPLRSALAPDAGGQDLATHYRELYAEVLAQRARNGQQGGWAASQYFRLLPACGPVPRSAIDPVAGSQYYFPKEYEVSIAPVRRSELATVLAECERLRPIDLDADRDVDVMVLVVLDDAQFTQRARQLEAPAVAGPAANRTGLLARIDVLALRLFALPPVHRVDTDADVWKPIWDGAAEADLLYVRRPPRTAETNVSAVVLARGFGVPEPGTASDAVDLEALEAELDAALVDAEQARADLARTNAANLALAATVRRLEAELARGEGSPLAEALARVAALQGEVAAREARIAMLESGERNAAILATALGAATDKITQREVELAAAQLELAELRAHLPALEADAAQLEGLRAELAAAREALAAAQVEVTGLQTALATQTVRADETTARSEAQAARADAQAARADEAAAQAAAEAARAAAATARADEISAALVQTRADLDAVKRALEAALAQQPPADAGLAIRLAELAVLRGNPPGVAEKLDAQTAGNGAARLAVVQVLTLAERGLDKLLWPTLTELGARPDALPSLVDGLAKLLGAGASVPQAFLELGPFFGLSDTLLAGWKSLAG
ncbi:MAG: hypothetical protein RLZZ584_3028 [Pseudomonadota bacterium]